MEQLNPDTLIILRILVKISSSIDNIDHLVESKYYRQKFKREIKFFMDEVTKTVDPIMIILMEKDDTTYPQLLKAITDYSQSMICGDEDKINIVLLYSKLKSALSDIDELMEVTKKESHLVLSIHPKIKSLVECIEKQFPTIVEAEDKDRVKVKSIVSRISGISKRVIDF